MDDAPKPVHAVATPDLDYQWQVFFPGRRCVLVGDTLADCVLIESQYYPEDDDGHAVPLASVPKIVLDRAEATLALWSRERLGRAAPDLLAACKLVLACVVGDSGRCHINEAGLDVVRAAVAKAEGGAP